MTTWVLDACAIIAFLRGEPGAEDVKQILLSQDVVVVHAANLCEVYYDFLRVAGKQAAEEAVSDLIKLHVAVSEEMRFPFWKDMAEIKAFYKVSFADCFAISLTRWHQDGELVTSDHSEFEPIAKAGICRVRFIR